MRIHNIYSYSSQINASKPRLVYDRDIILFQKQESSPSFQGNPITAVKDYLRYKKVQRLVSDLGKQLQNRPKDEPFHFRHLSMEAIEGLQYGIDVFKGLSMKDIQYLSENLHVIAVNRGCNNMCGYCYADAKPSNREMSWEDFTSITHGFKTIRERLCGFQLFGENMHKEDENLIYKSTELFYDSDGINLSIKDKNGKVHDFRELATEIYESLNRRTVFDTSGWAPENKVLQKRAEEYAQYFSNPENMDKLNQFNLSFNVFNASYIAAVKAFRAGDKERGMRLQNKFTDRISNAIFTFTPLLKNEKFQILQRAFGFVNNGKDFDIAAMLDLRKQVINKVKKLYEQDLNGEQKYIKSSDDIVRNIEFLETKLDRVSTALNSSGRMKEFMKSFNISASMQDHAESTKIMYEDIKSLGRQHRYLAHKLIDADGRVYHMDYARFFPTEIQLNIKNKSATPRLANLREDCPITHEMINRLEM